MAKKKNRKIKCINLKEFDYLGTTHSYCVYYLYFGDKFYIGSTANISKRITTHISCINTLYLSKRAFGGYFKIINHIKETGINEFTVKIYGFCSDNYSMISLEKFLLTKYFKNSNCLNTKT